MARSMPAAAAASCYVPVMSPVPREVSDRRYLLGSGLWFVIAGIIVGAVAIGVASGLPSRGVGAVLAAVLFTRGVLRLVRARQAAG
jgi:hypothetical protein